MTKEFSYKINDKLKYETLDSVERRIRDLSFLNREGFYKK